MEYRLATARDVEAIAGLHAASWQRNYRGAYSDSFLDGDVATDRLAGWTVQLTQESPDRCTIVAEHDGVVVGFAHTILDADATWGALLENLHVTHDLKRGGIGTDLLAETASVVLERAPARGLYLWVLEQNAAAQAFYRALGGTCVGRGLAAAPGGDPSRLTGAPAKLRFAWDDPRVLLPRE